LFQTAPKNQNNMTKSRRRHASTTDMPPPPKPPARKRDAALASRRKTAMSSPQQPTIPLTMLRTMREFGLTRVMHALASIHNDDDDDDIETTARSIEQKCMYHVGMRLSIRKDDDFASGRIGWSTFLLTRREYMSKCRHVLHLLRESNNHTLSELESDVVDRINYLQNSDRLAIPFVVGSFYQASSSSSSSNRDAAWTSDEIASRAKSILQVESEEAGMICSSCGQKSIRIMGKQLRAADEGETTMAICTNVDCRAQERFD
jgi:DNA-directed RNA polymerase subunit M/transcription elongation factor TFIIS